MLMLRDAAITRRVVMLPGLIMAVVMDMADRASHLASVADAGKYKQKSPQQMRAFLVFAMITKRPLSENQPTVHGTLPVMTDQTKKHVDSFGEISASASLIIFAAPFSTAGRVTS